MIDMARLQRLRTPAEVLQMMSEAPPGLAEARAKVTAMLDELDATLRPSSLVLGGFSQGSMLAVDVALRSERPLAGLVVMSGALIAESEWRPLAVKRAGLPVVQSHGTEDAILPFLVGEKLRDLLKGAGLLHTWVPFRGGHAIPDPVIEAVGDLLTERQA